MKKSLDLISSRRLLKDHFMMIKKDKIEYKNKFLYFILQIKYRFSRSKKFINESQQSIFAEDSLKYIFIIVEICLNKQKVQW